MKTKAGAFDNFVKLVREFDLEGPQNKATAHTSAAAVRLDQLDPEVQKVVDKQNDTA